MTILQLAQWPWVTLFSAYDHNKSDMCISALAADIFSRFNEALYGLVGGGTTRICLGPSCMHNVGPTDCLFARRYQSKHTVLMLLRGTSNQHRKISADITPCTPSGHASSKIA